MFKLLMNSEFELRDPARDAKLTILIYFPMTLSTHKKNPRQKKNSVCEGSHWFLSS